MKIVQQHPPEDPQEHDLSTEVLTAPTGRSYRNKMRILYTAAGCVSGVTVSAGSMQLLINTNVNVDLSFSFVESSRLESFRPIDETTISAKNEQHEEVVRLALSIIDKHPTFRETRNYFCSGEREIIVAEIAPNETYITLGFYQSTYDSRVTISEVQIANLIDIAKSLGIAQSDHSLYAALCIISTICHEAAHATHDRMLDQVAYQALQKSMNITPGTLEDEMLCRVKDFRIDRELTRILQMVFPEYRLSQQLNISDNCPVKDAYDECGMDGMVVQLRTMGYDKKPMIANDDELEDWQFTRQYPSLVEPIRNFYREEIGSALSIHDTPAEVDVAAGHQIATELLIGRESITDTQMRDGLEFISYQQAKLAPEVRLKFTDVRRMLDSRDSASTESFNADWLTICFGSDVSERAALLITLHSPNDVHSRRALDVQGRKLGLSEYVQPYIAQQLEEELATGQLFRSYEKISAAKFMASCNYLPQNSEVFDLLTETILMESRKSPETIDTTIIDWIDCVSQTHTLTQRHQALFDECKALLTAEERHF